MSYTFYHVNARQGDKDWVRFISYVTYQKAKEVADMIRRDYKTFECEIVFAEGWREHK